MNRQELIITRTKNVIQSVLGMILSPSAEKTLKEFIDTNLQFVLDMSDNDQVAELSEEYINMLNAGDFNSDIHNTSFDLVSFFGLNTIDRFIHAINPAAKRKKAYMCLDSRYAEFNTTCTKLSWLLSNTPYTTDNVANVLGPVRNIINIRMHSIVIRRLFDFATYERAMIQIEELSAQSFIAQSGFRFHFLGFVNPTLLPNALYVTYAAAGPGFFVPEFATFDKYELSNGPQMNDGYFRFNSPIKYLDKITIAIGSPEIIIIPKYEFKNITIIDVTNNYIDVELGELHYYSYYNPEVGYSVFLDGFKSSDASFNAIINAYDFTKVDPGFNSSRIRLYYDPLVVGFKSTPYAPTLIAPPPGPWTATSLRINSSRLILNFEIEYISD